MPRYLLIVDYRPGDAEAPMDQWKPEEISAHMNCHRGRPGCVDAAAARGSGGRCTQ